MKSRCCCHRSCCRFTAGCGRQQLQQRLHSHTASPRCTSKPTKQSHCTERPSHVGSSCCPLPSQFQPLHWEEASPTLGTRGRSLFLFLLLLPQGISEHRVEDRRQPPGSRQHAAQPGCLPCSHPQLLQRSITTSFPARQQVLHLCGELGGDAHDHLKGHSYPGDLHCSGPFAYGDRHPQTLHGHEDERQHEGSSSQTSSQAPQAVVQVDLVCRFTVLHGSLQQTSQEGSEAAIKQRCHLVPEQQRLEDEDLVVPQPRRHRVFPLCGRHRQQGECVGHVHQGAAARLSGVAMHVLQQPHHVQRPRQH